jgi:cob(I)alamin adenosyltransferase
VKKYSSIYINGKKCYVERDIFVIVNGNEWGFVMASGKVMIFMGDGYGKSAAALGVAMKRASEDDRVVIIQFLKGKGITDSQFTKRLEPEIKIFRFEKSEVDYNERTPEEQEEAAVNIRNGLNFARKVLATGECNLLILDEVLEVVNKDIISVEDLKELVESSIDTDIIITGSEMNVEVCKFADKISEIGNMQFKNF